ncbi:MAG: formimidoylglutamate deiminase [Rhodovibrionaceae bacterium]|nr:formimidoylglutamate deiminase [Rhodovibrionaceae bacterium]
MTSRRYFAPLALLPDGWAADVLLVLGPQGELESVSAGESPAEDVQRLDGPVIPGMPNLHSHAFQRAMAGLAERAGVEEDSFWTWREVMYGFLQRLGPEDVQAIAAQLYVEMLRAGYTAVGEFHYLHHDPDGRPYADRAEMGRRIAAAARETGIGLTLLPVLYGFGGFGGQAAGHGQRRFLNDPDGFLEILHLLHDETDGDPQMRVGIAPHSLRAVTQDTMQAALSGLDAIAADAPVHSHVAEQRKEVEDCIAWCAKRPVEWLLESAEVDRRWCLVHATHLTEDETRTLARSGAVAGLCPTTEANLGDGLFPAPEFLAAGGTFGIGSDSHISVSPVEELRWLEYGQRLVHLRRNVLATAKAGGSVGHALYVAALRGGAQAMGRPIGRIEAGARADLVVLDADAPTLAGRGPETLLDALIFAGNANPVRHVMVGGTWAIVDGAHPEEARILTDYRSTLERLTA